MKPMSVCTQVTERVLPSQRSRSRDLTPPFFFPRLLWGRFPSLGTRWRPPSPGQLSPGRRLSFPRRSSRPWQLIPRARTAPTPTRPRARASQPGRSRGDRRPVGTLPFYQRYGTPGLPTALLSAVSAKLRARPCALKIRTTNRTSAGVSGGLWNPNSNCA